MKIKELFEDDNQERKTLEKELLQAKTRRKFIKQQRTIDKWHRNKYDNQLEITNFDIDRIQKEIEELKNKKPNRVKIEKRK